MNADMVLQKCAPELQLASILSVGTRVKDIATTLEDVLVAPDCNQNSVK
jgi:hypothetical protein